ncbi:thio(seleno)oxazole modification radical SAM maturase SbtM [Spirochaetota bacterium]
MTINDIYPKSCTFLTTEIINNIQSNHNDHAILESLSEILSSVENIPPFVQDIAKLERALYTIRLNNIKIPRSVDHMSVNPTLHLLDLEWSGLWSFLTEESDSTLKPGPNSEMVAIYRNPKNNKIEVVPAGNEIVLAIKIIIENIKWETVCETGGYTLRDIDTVIEMAVTKGILLKPQPKIIRIFKNVPAAQTFHNEFLVSDFFTLQWHITQTCDLHCKHCYDRSNREEMHIKKAIAVLDDLRNFCQGRNVKGQVSFSGGNPLLYPNFIELYKAAADRGFALAILGNPTGKEMLEKILEIEEPEFFQVSLEGLQDHNDNIRGGGNYLNVLDFLHLLKQYKIYSMVMLTITKENIEQVLPLAEVLRDKTDQFNFNRLAMVGEGAQLQSPDIKKYTAFLETYLEETKNNPTMGTKDNLLNIIYNKKNINLFGGCTGYGCGAAFNFMTLLSDGEMHACRKLPSLLGNAFDESLEDIYESSTAEKYRQGCVECANCEIRPACGGCLAVSYGCGIDIFNERDPYCFIDNY